MKLSKLFVILTLSFSAAFAGCEWDEDKRLARMEQIKKEREMEAKSVRMSEAREKIAALTEDEKSEIMGARRVVVVEQKRLSLVNIAALFLIGVAIGSRIGLRYFKARIKEV